MDSVINELSEEIEQNIDLTKKDIEKKSHEIEGISRRIEAGREYVIKRMEFKGFVFYKIPIKQRRYDGTTAFFDYEIYFSEDPQLFSGDKIIIKKAIENFKDNKRDKYHFVPFLQIIEFEAIRKDESPVAEAYKEYEELVSESYLQITDADLPF